MGWAGINRFLSVSSMATGATWAGLTLEPSHISVSRACAETQVRGTEQSQSPGTSADVNLRI